MEKRNHNALVTGAGSGIGRATALRLAETGIGIIVHYGHNRDAAFETEALIHERFPEVSTLVLGADLTEEDAVRNLVSEAEKAGPVDILVNNAGITRDNLTLLMKSEDFDAVISADLRSVFLVSKYASRAMLKRKYGRIINISSVVGLHGNAGQANYAAAKAGVIGLTKSLAKEFARKGITVNAVAPGFIETRMTAVLSEEAKKEIAASIPVGRNGRPEDVANAVRFFASEESGYITGQVLAVDGGIAI